MQTSCSSTHTLRVAAFFWAVALRTDSDSHCAALLGGRILQLRDCGNAHAAIAYVVQLHQGAMRERCSNSPP